MAANNDLNFADAKLAVDMILYLQANLHVRRLQLTLNIIVSSQTQ